MYVTFLSHRFLVLTVGLLNTNLAVAQSTEQTVTVFLDTDAGPPPFNARECIAMFDTLDQVYYICREHTDMLPLLLYAESMAKDECEKQFQNEIWNCSDFSLLKTPKINKGCELMFFLESSLYVIKPFTLRLE